jgi:vancomycin permeability regulator SanA
MKKVKNNNKKSKTLFKVSLIMFMGCLFILLITFGIYFHVYFKSLDYLYTDKKLIPKKPVAIVFGAGYYQSGRLSMILQDRVDTAIDLYKIKKVKKLLMTGANNSTQYDEPSAMKRYAIRQGVPEEDIILDYAGFRTYDSLYRARDVFLVKSAILVTQRYHLYRAVYTARKLGLDAIGIESNRRRYLKEDWYETRELLAILLSFVETNLTKPKPHFLGEKIPIFSDDD